ncbi:MAG: hypothetical protein Q9227_006547 [Pyrenula ochraceoflavens]
MNRNALLDPELSLVAFSRLPQRIQRDLGVVVSDAFLLGVIPSTWCREQVVRIPLWYRVKDHPFFCALAPVTAADPGSMPVRRILPEHIDYDILKGWLKSCISKHGTLCHQSSIFNLSKYKIKMIDCLRRCIVPAPDGCEYIALSYVWGATPETYSKGLKTGHCPQLIEDAINVTGRLGFRYLWVDRYCIDQEYENDKHHQIRNMNQIYANAEATLVASAGETPSAGLPGVGKTPRIPQESAVVGDYLLRPVIPSICSYNLVSDSKWATRAWTYQEAVLSRRRLIFTQRQVLFECGLVNCQEQLYEPHWITGRDSEMRQIRESHNSKSDEASSFALQLFLRSNPDLESSVRIFDHINRYTARELSHESDAINGILGILRAYRNTRHGVRHLQGIPILPSKCFRRVFSKDFSNEQTVFGLCWRSGTEQCLEGNPMSRRVLLFPSWSWAGWKLPVSVTYRHYNLESDYVYQQSWDATIKFELEDGKMLSCNEAVESAMYEDALERALRYLHVYAPILKIRFKETNGKFLPTYSYYYPMATFFDEPIVKGSALFERLSQGDSFDGIVLNAFKPSRSLKTLNHTNECIVFPLSILVTVRIHGDPEGYSERVGIIWCGDENGDMPGTGLIAEWRRIRLG